MGSIVVLQVPPGSIVFMQGIVVDTEDGMDRVLTALRRAAGHDQFAVITDDGDGEVEVWGADVDIMAKLAEHGLGICGHVVIEMGGGARGADGRHHFTDVPMKCVLPLRHEGDHDYRHIGPS